MDAAEMNRRIEIEMLKFEMNHNNETISTLRSRNIEIAIQLANVIHGVSVGDTVMLSNGTEYKVCSIHPRVLLLSPANLEKQVKPWVMGHPHTKDGIGWDESKEINLYGNWERVS